MYMCICNSPASFALAIAICRNYLERLRAQTVHSRPSGSLCHAIAWEALADLTSTKRRKRSHCATLVLMCRCRQQKPAHKRHSERMSDKRWLTLPEALPPAIPITYAPRGFPAAVYHGARLCILLSAQFQLDAFLRYPPGLRELASLVLRSPRSNTLFIDQRVM